MELAVAVQAGCMADAALTRNPENYINRELSWLAFNDRVLAQALDDRLPLLERLKFLGIWASNLDEFFQVRVAGLKDLHESGRFPGTADGLSPASALAAIREIVDDQQDQVDQCFTDLLEELSLQGIELLHWADLDPDDRSYLTNEFQNRIFPILTPLAVDPGHPFPYISNLSLSLGVILRDPSGGNRRFARLKVPDMLGRFLKLPDSQRFVAIEEVVFAHIEQLFPGMEVVETVAFRVTRNADLDIDEDEAINLLSAVEVELRRRRFQKPVRLELSRSPSKDTAELLITELKLHDSDVYVSDVPLNLTDVMELAFLDRPDLRDAPHKPVTPAAFRSDDDEPANLFALMRERDLLVHHPYESFNATVDELLAQASTDRKVLAIKMTMYRTSGDSPVVDHLIRAAEHGKQVAVVVELKARFDEAANIEWARRLEEAGVHVAYGLIGLKVHTKTLLIVRSESEGVRRYCHVGTGNYNSRTARLYTDLGLFTADPAVGEDLAQLFNTLTGYGRDVSYQRLLVAPHGLRPNVTALLQNEISFGSAGHITLKMNSLVDAAMIDLLYEASQAGVRVDLIVRGICCLRPQVPGLSDNIHVRSLVGSFLEHSRILRFANGNGVGAPEYMIGSADLMPRNLDRRVEAMVTIDDPKLQERLDELLTVQLADRYLAWELGSDGTYTRVGHDAETNAQTILTLLANERRFIKPEVE